MPVYGGEKLQRFLASKRAQQKRMPSRVEVGFYGPVAAKATANEYGIPEHGIPQRPFFRQALAAALPKIRRTALELAQRDGAITDAGALALAKILADELRLSIERFSEPPNKPWKGRSDPLVFTGELKAAIEIRLFH